MSYTEKCVEFLNQDGEIIRGILHYANQDNCKDISLICLNTGLNDMVGWHRLQVKVSRFFADCGYNVLRFDDAGIGDSEGEILEESIVEIFSDIETGLFVQNADAAIDFITDKFPNEKIVFLGFCGGGLTAIYSAVKNKKIAGIVDIGGPVTLSSNEYLYKKDPWEVQKNVKKYRSKFLKIKPWIRFLTFRGEYKTIVNSIIHFLKHKIKGEYKNSLSDKDFKEIKNLNRKFFISFEKYAKTKRPVLFFYAEHDSATWEFKKYFLNKYQNTSLWLDTLFSFVEAENANHILSMEESQTKLKQEILLWLGKI